ncbi:uncharacterized protein LOC126696350 [Quercus robur]|uniref:uncharacterized protein LOC126696350 n=1 Tax=Quercus robur TaxID=38942 RepID=UPI0021620557|nr:uncharacterized protein LOC126696350 [Quercus robur]
MITETRIDGPKVDEIIRRLPFDGAYSTETIGYVGRIWLLWRLDFVSMDIMLAMEQEIHAIVQVSYHAQPWLLSSIYGSPRFRERCLLWGNLKILSERHNLPWAVMGDFNDVVCDDEKMRGPKFTWTNKEDLPGLIQALDNPPIRIGERPFWFQSSWLNHASFPPIFRDAWEGNQQNIRSAIITFTLKARNWNREKFGNIFWKKRNLVARLGGVEKALAQNPSQRLINMHSWLFEELEKIMSLEEEL